MKAARILLAASALCAALPAIAQAPDADIQAPVYRIGDKWVWNVRVNPRDRCTTGIGSDAKLVQVVTGVDDGSYTVHLSGPAAGFEVDRVLGKDLSFQGEVDAQKFRSDVFGFPIRVGKTWEAKLRTGPIYTVLACQAEKPETMKLGQQDVQVAPISCKGTWKNLTSGSSDQATYKFWYSPEHRNFVRRTVYTYFRGSTCADLEFQLDPEAK